MSLSMLANGADCGPSNALQTLTKRLDQDRGIQQDHFGAGRAGSSKQTFRTPRSQEVDAEAARFFSGSPHAAQPLNHISPFHLADLQHALPTFAPHAEPKQQQQWNNAPPSAWATDFLQQAPRVSVSQSSNVVPIEKAQTSHISTPINSPGPSQWQPVFANRIGFMSPGMHSPAPMSLATHQDHAPSRNQVAWEKEFTLQEQAISSVPAQEATTQQPIDQDELARTAGLLIEQIKDEQNPKFQNSQFLSLMRQLRDREVVVDGTTLVEASQATGNMVSNVHIDLKGKGKAVPLSFGAQQANFDPQSQAQDMPPESDLDHYLRQENEAYKTFWQDFNRKSSNRINIRDDSWDLLQDQWERFEATNSGIRPVEVYTFQSNNPYLLGEGSVTKNHSLHAYKRLHSLSDSILELEAAVQRSPKDASAWFDLGVKQQENEREQKAVQALQRAIELDPSHLPSWLALAISHTNDNSRALTFSCMSEWVERNDKYKDTVAKYRAEHPFDVDASTQAKFNHLIGCLIAMARSDTTEGLDADIQVALAVLLNSNQDYDKAQDCFRAALSVRPDDWLLHNRVGATLANSGKAEEALQFYANALALNPNYIRARYNMGISCINLLQYESAAQHIIDALTLQESDRAPDPSGFNESRGVTSRALWESLKTACLHMQRIDLATLCDQGNLNNFRDAFYT